MQEALILDEGMLIPESFIFDTTNENWHPNPEYNLFFLQRYEALFNDKLLARGYIFLNEVLEALGIKPVRCGQILGWGNTPDTQIQFDITEDGDVYIITFNVQGDILSLLQEM